MKKKVFLLLFIALYLCTVFFAKAFAQTYGTTFISSGTRPEGMIAKDINADGRMDIVFNNSYSGLINFATDFRFNVLLGDGQGGFSLSGSYSYVPSPQSQLYNSVTHDIGLHDYDGDGLQDVVLNLYDSIGISYQNPNGTFGQVNTYHANRTTENFAIDEATGKILISHFQLPIYTPSYSLADPSAAGFTITEIVTPEWRDDFVFYGSQIFARTPSGIIEQDFAGNVLTAYSLGNIASYTVSDGKLYAASSGSLYEFSLGQNTTPNISPLPSTAYDANDISVVDLDADGTKEFVFVSNSGITIADKSGNGTLFASQYSFVLPVHSLCIADYNGDGKQDIACPIANYFPAQSGINLLLSLSSTTSLTQLQNALPQVLVYPNPTTDVLYVSGISDKASLTVYDAKGSFIKKSVAVNSLNVSDLLPGVYTLLIEDKSKTLSKKFAKN